MLFRFTLYSSNLKVSPRLKYRVYNKVSDYLEYVFKMAGKNDTIYGCTFMLLPPASKLAAEL